VPSNSPASAAVAAPSRPASTVDGSNCQLLPLSCPTIRPAAARTSSPRCDHASPIATSSCRKLGMPPRGAGG
jgi:hypothetical protein